MKPVWFFYVVLGIGFTFMIYITTLGAAQWWYIMYYIILAFLGVLGIWSTELRWKFIIGLVLGLILLVVLYKYEVLTFTTRMPILRKILELLELQVR